MWTNGSEEVPRRETKRVGESRKGDGYSPQPGASLVGRRTGAKRIGDLVARPRCAG